jgi:hypothetical protein
MYAVKSLLLRLKILPFLLLFCINCGKQITIEGTIKIKGNENYEQIKKTIKKRLLNYGYRSKIEIIGDKIRIKGNFKEIEQVKLLASKNGMITVHIIRDDTLINNKIQKCIDEDNLNIYKYENLKFELNKKKYSNFQTIFDSCFNHPPINKLLFHKKQSDLIDAYIIKRKPDLADQALLSCKKSSYKDEYKLKLKTRYKIRNKKPLYFKFAVLIDDKIIGIAYKFYKNHLYMRMIDNEPGVLKQFSSICGTGSIYSEIKFK